MSKPTSEPFIFSLKFAGKTWKGEGATPLEALQNVPVPEKIMSKGVLTVSQGKKKKELLYSPAKLKRLFYPNAQPVIVKYLSMLLK